MVTLESNTRPQRRWAKVLLCVACLAPSASTWTADVEAEARARALLNTPIGYAGLTCGQCQHNDIVWCGVIPKAAAVAVTQGAKQLSVHKRYCVISDDIGDYSPCFVSAVYQFERMRFVKNIESVGSEDQFVSDYLYDHYRPLNRQGVAIDTDRTYLIFAFRRPRSLRPEAPWNIQISCEVSAAVATEITHQEISVNQ